jgi:2-polyprenyl-3-methyl-5-hydroxy-6-metoxy-1,4-benzoquinol methylase
MNHVIEHVHDPVALMAECARILKPGGSLVIVTPNIESYGHRVFGAFWRGLEPPRHLHIFSLSALTRCAERAGFRSSKSWTTPVNAASFYLSSRALKESKPSKTGLSGQSIASLFDATWFKLAETVLGQLRSTVGEELVLKADR